MSEVIFSHKITGHILFGKQMDAIMDFLKLMPYVRHAFKEELPKLFKAEVWQIHKLKIIRFSFLLDRQPGVTIWSKGTGTLPWLLTEFLTLLRLSTPSLAPHPLLSFVLFSP